MPRFRVHYNAHRYSDHSDRPVSRSWIIKAETIEDAEQIMSDLRDAQGDAPRPEGHRPYIGIIHFGHTETL